jgi:predicted regulator of Ras-like GTPase activity (Roadblock/LC7/MglB family)
MRQILKTLNEQAKLDGSMVITPDGIMVAAALGRNFQEDAVAAFAASLLIALKRGVAKLRARSRLNSCTLVGTHGRIVFYDMENSYLVLVAEADTSLEARASAIEHAILEIKNRRVA